MFAICCRHLLGISVATDTSRREPPEEPEWPLEPARVQMAFAAAYFETDRDPDEREALLWLESLDPPEIYAPPATERSAVTRYVPVNDTLTMPEQRPKQARTFPTMVMQDAEHDTTYLVWSKTIVPDELREAMHRLASNITRVGHSSAVVQVWIDESEELPNLLNEQRSNHGLQFWTPDSDAVVAANVVTMRVPARQMLDGLIRDYNEEEVEAFNKLEEQIAAAKGATKRKLKEEMKNRLNDIEPTVRRPLIRTTARYSKASTADSSRFSTVFDDQMLVLSKHESHNLGLESTLQLTAALRGTILAQFGDDEIQAGWDTVGISSSGDRHASVCLGRIRGRPSARDGAGISTRHSTARTRASPETTALQT